MTNPPPIPKPKRHWYQYRLRTLLIVMAIVSACLGWWSYKVRQQLEAVAAFTKIGGRVTYDSESSKLKRLPHWPAWLVDQVGVDYFACATTLDLADTQVTDAGLKHIKGLTALHELYLRYTQVTDAGLEHIKGLTALQELCLYHTQVTDAGLEQIKGLTALKWLSLGNTHVTEAGVNRLQQALPNCAIQR